MKGAIKKEIGFIGKSMLWSLLLYTACMLLINWEDVKIHVKGSSPVTISDNRDTLLQPVNKPAKPQGTTTQG